MAEFALPGTRNPASFNAGETAPQRRRPIASPRDEVRCHEMPAITELRDTCNLRNRCGPGELRKLGRSLAAPRIRDTRNAIGF